MKHFIRRHVKWMACFGLLWLSLLLGTEDLSLADSMKSGLSDVLPVSNVEHNEIRSHYNPDYKETTYSMASEDCKIRLIVYHSEINKGVMKYRPDCLKSLKDQADMLSILLCKASEDMKGRIQFHTLFWGILSRVNQGDMTMSMRLALAASKDAGWDTKSGRPLSGHANDFVEKLANGIEIYKELKDRFKSIKIRLEVSGVEKVQVHRAEKLPFFDALKIMGVKPSAKLPYNCLTWFSLDKIN